MFKSYSNIHDAIAEARRVTKKQTVASTPAYVFSDHTRRLFYVATSCGWGYIASAVGHFRGGRGSIYRQGNLDYCGDRPNFSQDQLAALATLPEQEELPGDQEQWYGLCAGHTAGWSHEQLLTLAERCDETGNGVWHESHRLARELNSGLTAGCPCGKCRK